MNKILGHAVAESVLVNAILHDKVFPTWIFSGPFGVGKATLAYKFAKCLLAGATPVNGLLDIDDDNVVHKLVNMRTHPDLFVLEQTEDNISIDQTKILLNKIRKTPTLSKWRVVIIENASTLNKNIYNSLLKILEEPPKRTVIILICNHTGLVPKTLLSRAAKLHLKPLTPDLVCSALIEKNVQNAVELSRIAQDSIGYAIFLHENNGIEVYNRILGIFRSEHYTKNYLAFLKYYQDEDINFNIVKNIVIRILKMYVDVLLDVADEKYLEENKLFVKYIASKSIDKDSEIKKVLEIIEKLYLYDAAMLDKTAILLRTFEKFFN